MRKLFGFAFLRVTDKDQIVVKDDLHDLCVYKADEKTKIDVKKYCELPCVLDDLNDPQNLSRVTNHLHFRASESERFTISTLLCSGKFTQSGELLGILNWRGEQFKGHLSESLEALCQMDGGEIVKFLHDILDALFGMLNPESPSSKHAIKIFLSLVHIFTLIHHLRFENFKPVLETYITDIFSAPLIHKPILQCFAELISAAYRDKAEGTHKLVQIFQAMDYIMRFVVRSRELQQKVVYDHSGDSGQEFHTNVHTLFDCMGHLLASNSDNIKSNQMTLLGSLHKVYDPLMKVLLHSDIASLIDLALYRMPSASEIQLDLTQAKLDLLRKTVETPLFSTQGPRQLLLPLCLRQIEDCLQSNKHVKLTVELLGDILDTIFNLKETSDIKDDIEQLVLALFDIVMDAVAENKSAVKGPLIVCLTEMLRMMDDKNYDSLLAVRRGAQLKAFLSKILKVFLELVQPEVFPKDWTTMRMVTNNVLFTAVEYFSQALKDHYRQNDRFDPELWNNYFNLAVAFITQSSLQLDTYSKAKAQKLKERYQDMRVLMGMQVATLWNTLGRKKEYFIPNLVGPFLQLTLVPEPEVRKATLPIIFDMMITQNAINHHFSDVEAAVIERLDYFLTQQYGDREYKVLFHDELLDRVQSEPSLSDTGTKFIISVTDLLEKLLDYRQVIDGDENRDKRMHCTFNILNFYKDEINREEMYIRYVNKLFELHMNANNYTEAGLTLQLYAKLLQWSDNNLPAELRYPSQKEWVRKDMLYQEIINCFDQGKVWEYGIPLCKELADFYERNYEYKKLGDILKLQASFYNKILEGVQGNDPSQPDAYCPRQDPSYYRVAYYGQSFPAFVRNKQFIYRGDECLKLSTIINHLTSEFPDAQIIPNNNPQNEEIKDGEQQYIQIGSVKALPEERADFRHKVVPTEIRNFYNVNEVDTFQFDRPYHREKKDPNNESKTLCIERTKMKTNYKFPGILRWYEVVGIEVEMLCPIKIAIETMVQYNSELETLITRCMAHPKLYFNNLEMRLQGTINAAVNGGISKYHEAFFTKEFESNYPNEYIHLDKLKDLLQEQISILTKGLRIHKNLAPADLQPLHENLEILFKKMKGAVSTHGTPHGSSLNLSASFSERDRPGTPGGISQGSGGSRSSTDESLIMAAPDNVDGKHRPVSKSESDPALPNIKSPPPVIPALPRGGTPKERQSQNVMPSSLNLPPRIPGHRKGSELESGDSKDDDDKTPPKLPTKAGAWSRKTVMDNLLKPSDSSIEPKKSPRQVKRSSTAVGTTSSRVPQLPEKRLPLSSQTEQRNSSSNHVGAPTTPTTPNRNSGNVDVSTPPPIPKRKGSYNPGGEPLTLPSPSNGMPPTTPTAMSSASKADDTLRTPPPVFPRKSVHPPPSPNYKKKDDSSTNL